MLKKDFWYDLPKELIAQEPADPRDSARLMVLDRKNDTIEHRIFHDLPEYLNAGDVLVVNNSKVLPARLMGVKVPTGAVCEVLLLRQAHGDTWECLARPGRRMQAGTKLSFGDGSLTATVDETLYAKELGSAAAPTAGLHFTPELLDTIRAKGVNIVEVTLHVGLGTFRPVNEDNIQEHQMHTEWYCVDDTAAEAINAARASGHRVIAVGTTSCRTLEAVWAKYGKIVPCSGTTDIFLYPGVELHAIDGLVTNFHLPESTLIMLISAFYGYEKTMAAYKVAVQEKYRFFSFGDAMFIQ